jgi:hypothetical protein
VTRAPEPRGATAPDGPRAAPAPYQPGGRVRSAPQSRGQGDPPAYGRAVPRGGSAAPGASAVPSSPYSHLPSYSRPSDRRTPGASDVRPPAGVRSAPRDASGMPSGPPRGAGVERRGPSESRPSGPAAAPERRGGGDAGSRSRGSQPSGGRAVPRGRGGD